MNGIQSQHAQPCCFSACLPRVSAPKVEFSPMMELFRPEKIDGRKIEIIHLTPAFGYYPDVEAKKLQPRDQIDTIMNEELSNYLDDQSLLEHVNQDITYESLENLIQFFTDLEFNQTIKLTDRTVSKFPTDL